ncbi:MAG: CapA family protein [Chloroflexi bacterium]|nr:CapA family protein [Chloroflexota bacterium]
MRMLAGSVLRVLCLSLVLLVDPSPFLSASVPASGSSSRITLALGGDVGLGRYVEVKSREHNDWLYPIKNVAPFFRYADLSCLNFEEPLTSRRVPCNTCMRLGSYPDAVAALTYAGIDVVSLANNHQGDFGSEGVIDNIANLDEAGIAHAGAGADESSARRAATVRVKGVTFGFLSYNEVPPADYSATQNTPGTAWLTAQNLREDIARYRPLVDVLIVLPHWGVEYTNAPTNFQTEMAHLAIDCGADVVVGNHPHWVQQVETYRGRPIFYGLGNLIFDQMWSTETRQGMALELQFDGPVLITGRVHPYLIYDYCQPRFVYPGDSTYNAVLQRAGLVSDKMEFNAVATIRQWLAAGHHAPIPFQEWLPTWRRR